MAAFVAFASFGFFSSLAPSFVAGTLHHTSHVLAGFVASSAFGSAVIAQVVAAKWRTRELYPAGLITLATGLALTVGAILTSTLGTLVAGGIVVGLGAGLTFKGGVSAVIALAPPAVRGETLAALFLVAYVGMGLPVVLLGIALQLVAVHAAVIGFGALMLLLIVASGLLISAGRRPRMALA